VEVSVNERVILALMGPTAAGKTEIALALAERLPVALISVDSAMVYRGLDIGTAKPDCDQQRRHPHALIDIREPSETYSVGEFVTDARSAAAAALHSGRLPLLVGGTMLYFKAFREGIAELPRTSPAVRAELSDRARREGLEALHAELARVDPAAAARVHPRNPQRLLRALEVHRESGRPISSWWSAQTSEGVAAALGCRLLEIAIVPPRAEVDARIERRFAKMLEAGLVEEVELLRRRADLHSGLPSMRAVGYRQVWQHLEGHVDRAGMIENAVRATRSLAKRQRTWLRSFRTVRTIDSSSVDPVGEILQYLHAVSILGPH
jgi:tRNA dimethylallyltransferase